MWLISDLINGKFRSGSTNVQDRLSKKLLVGLESGPEEHRLEHDISASGVFEVVSSWSKFN